MSNSRTMAGVVVAGLLAVAAAAVLILDPAQPTPPPPGETLPIPTAAPAPAHPATTRRTIPRAPSAMPAEDAWVTTESGLAYADLVIGNGATPSEHSVVEVEYTGWLESGKVLDSSYKRPESFELVLGVGSVVRGWDEGISTMRAGGKRLLRLPPELHYGPAGRPPRVPPNHILLFEIELLSVGALRKPPDAPPEVSTWQTLPSGLSYAILDEGQGAAVAKGQTAKVEYTGWLENGKQFDSSFNRVQTLDFRVGGGRVIKAWDQGVEGMKVGERRALKVPPDLGYGAAGFPPVIPPDAALLFEVSLTGVD